MINVVIFGCQQIAVDFMKYLRTLKNVEISLIVTYELSFDKIYGYASVLEEATKIGLNVKNLKNLDSALIDDVRSLNPDIIFSVYYRKILSRELLQLPRRGCVNIHPGLLPKYRGTTPTAWAIQNGETTFGITIHYMDEGIDTGDILVQQEFPIFAEETGYELYTRSMKLGAEMLKENFYNIVNQELTPRKQVEPGSYYGKRASKYTIDWQQKAEDIKNLVRVLAKPYNSAEAILFNKYILINRVSIIRDPKYPAQCVGKIVNILDNDRLVVSCADGCLVLEDYEVVPALKDGEKELILRIGNKFE